MATINDVAAQKNIDSVRRLSPAASCWNITELDEKIA